MSSLAHMLNFIIGQILTYLKKKPNGINILNTRFKIENKVFHFEDWTEKKMLFFFVCEIYEDR